MRVHSQLQCFYSLDKKECVEGIRITSEETMRFENRTVHSFEIFSKQDSADCVSVTIQEFGSGMHNEVDAEAKGLLQIWCGEGVVAGNGNVMTFRDLRDRFYVDALQGWICWSLEVDESDLFVFFKRLLCFGRIAKINHYCLDAERRKHDVDQFFRSAIQ